jgi:GTP-binding protein
MNIKSAKFVKGITGPDSNLDDGIPQIAFIGRSNVGKSSVINSLIKQKGMARTSSYPGRTQQINLFLINKAFYLVDLPGYGFAKVPPEVLEQIRNLIEWYLFDMPFEQKYVVLIVDAKVGPTDLDLDMLHRLEQRQKNIIIIANKVDTIKRSLYEKQLKKIINACGMHKVIAYSAEKGVGVGELINELIGK